MRKYTFMGIDKILTWLMRSEGEGPSVFKAYSFLGLFCLLG